ncbi:MAG: hypothetical protein IJX92_05550 [Clostridia bacterium]|nr:hypothetical protein [Clostridia bacterium]
MYSRSFYTTEEENTRIPTNYDGTAFSTSEVPSEVSEEPDAEQASADASESVSAGVIDSVRIPFLSGLFGKGGLLGTSSLKLPKIGTEEILIIAAALFLLFSKDGDMEIAVMLLILLLIN